MLLGFIEEIEVVSQGANLAVAIRHRHEGKTYEVTAHVRRVEFHRVQAHEERRGPGTVYNIQAPDLAAIILGATLHVCPRSMIHEFLRPSKAFDIVGGRSDDQPVRHQV